MSKDAASFIAIASLNWFACDRIWRTEREVLPTLNGASMAAENPRASLDNFTLCDQYRSTGPLILF